MTLLLDDYLARLLMNGWAISFSAIQNIKVAQFVALVIALLIAGAMPADSQGRNIAGCLAIADVDERIECLEGRAPAPAPSELSVPRIGRPRPTEITPSFDCRIATTAIERAICSDELLADWDARMGRAFQQSMRIGGDNQTLLEAQRLWLALRNRSCGSSPEISRSCLLEMTKQRTLALSAGNTAIPNPATTSPPNLAKQSVQPIQPSATRDEFSVQSGRTDIQNTPSKSITPERDTSPSLFPFLIILSLGAWVAWKISRYIRRKREVAEDLARREEEAAYRREKLIAKFGEYDAFRILAGNVWEDMTAEQLLESWGQPVERDRQVTRTKIRETWKYNQTGKNRFDHRVKLENGVVIGWTE